MRVAYGIMNECTDVVALLHDATPYRNYIIGSISVDDAVMIRMMNISPSAILHNYPYAFYDAVTANKLKFSTSCIINNAYWAFFKKISQYMFEVFGIHPTYYLDIVLKKYDIEKYMRYLNETTVRHPAFEEQWFEKPTTKYMTHISNIASVNPTDAKEFINILFSKDMTNEAVWCVYRSDLDMKEFEVNMKTAIDRNPALLSSNELLVYITRAGIPAWVPEDAAAVQRFHDIQKRRASK